jgi:hypothetical protein
MSGSIHQALSARALDRTLITVPAERNQPLAELIAR